MEKNRTIILGFYAALSLIIILCCMPNFDLQNYGYLFSFVVLVTAYICRYRWPRNDSYEENHTTFVIRTLWLYNAFAAFGFIGAAIIIAQNGNMDSVNAMADRIVAGEILSEDQMNASMMQYISDNESLLKQQFLLWLSPAQIYMVWRILRGGERAFKGYRIANPKNWF